ALLPGSRRSEVRSLLPGMLETVVQLARERPLAPRLIVAPSLDEAFLAELVGQSGLAAAGIPLDYVRGEDRFAAVADSHLALCASGTATLETGLLGVPMIVLYRLKTLTYW